MFPLLCKVSSISLLVSLASVWMVDHIRFTDDQGVIRQWVLRLDTIIELSVVVSIVAVFSLIVYAGWWL